MPVLGYEIMTSQEICPMGYSAASEYMVPAHVWEKQHNAPYSDFQSRSGGADHRGINVTYNSEGLLTFETLVSTAYICLFI